MDVDRVEDGDDSDDESELDDFDFEPEASGGEFFKSIKERVVQVVKVTKTTK